MKSKAQHKERRIIVINNIDKMTMIEVCMALNDLGYSWYEIEKMAGEIDLKYLLKDCYNELYE